VVADVTQPPIGADFLSHYGLLVDCKEKRLLDGVTSSSAPAQATSSRILSAKVMSAITPVDNILSEFPNLTRPTGIQHEVRHNTFHHIRTTQGPPVTFRPRRLAPDRLAIAKAEFDAMLRDGTARRSKSSWSSALHIVPKNDNGWRPCGEYRALNARTIPDRYPVRYIHNYSHQLTGCRSPRSIWFEHTTRFLSISAISRRPPSPLLRNAAHMFQRFMDDILRGLDFCFAYLDDILVFSQSLEGHEHHSEPSSTGSRQTASLSTLQSVSSKHSKSPSSVTKFPPRVPDRLRNEWPTYGTTLLP
jgi:hypothetical protein